MKTIRCNLLRSAAFVAALPLLAAVSGLRAQESTVALGIVRGNGTLESSANPVSGVVASVRNAAGNYTVTVTSAGAFAGSSPSDYLVHTTIQSILSGDITTNARVGSVTADVLTVQVRTGDVETTTNLYAVVETDSPFYFPSSGRTPPRPSSPVTRATSSPRGGSRPAARSKAVSGSTGSFRPASAPPMAITW